MTWRKLIALFTAVCGISFAIVVFTISTAEPFGAQWVAQSELAILGITAAAIAFFIHKGRYWALWILRIVSLLTIVGLLVLFAITFPTSKLLPSSVIGTLFFFLFIFSMPSFFLLVLWHPQVVAEFKVKQDEL